MLDIMSRAKDAINTYNAQLQINAANIANLSVPGYKGLKISFQTIFEKVINGGTAATGALGGTNPKQLGSNVGVGNVSLDFTQGAKASGNNLDLFINGTGLFQVSPDGGKTFLYSRAGQFSLDANGDLMTANGMQVYGFTSGNTPIPITGLRGFNQQTLSWSNDGRLVEYTDNTFATENRDTGYRAALTSFANLSGLAQAEGSAFAQTDASGAPMAFQAAGGDFGQVTPRNYEQSNVFYTGEVIDSLSAQRAMSANLTMVRSISDEISNFISRIS